MYGLFLKILFLLFVQFYNDDYGQFVLQLVYDENLYLYFLYLLLLGIKVLKQLSQSLLSLIWIFFDLVRNEIYVVKYRLYLYI